MATRPSTLPPRWAQTAGGSLVIGANAPLQPASTKLDAGFAPAEKPPAPFLNWLFNQVCQWLLFFFAATFSAKQAMFAGSWVKQTSPVATTLNSVAVSPLTVSAPGSAFWVAVGAVSTNPVVITSPDGDTWTARTGVGTLPWVDVASRGTLMVAIALGGSTTTSIYSSSDGITWTARTAPAGVTIGVPAITWSARLGLWIVVQGGGANGAMSSPDGITWTGHTLGSAGTDQFWSVVDAPAAGLLVAVGRTNLAVNLLWTSADGLTWTARTIANTSVGLVAVAYNAVSGVIMAVDTNGNTFTSTNGTTWTIQAAVGATMNNGSSTGKILLHNGEAWIALFTSSTSIGGLSYSVDDGVTWNIVRDGILPANRAFALSPKGRMIAVGTSGVVYASVLSLAVV